MPVSSSLQQQSSSTSLQLQVKQNFEDEPSNQGFWGFTQGHDNGNGCCRGGWYSNIQCQLCLRCGHIATYSCPYYDQPYWLQVSMSKTPGLWEC